MKTEAEIKEAIKLLKYGSNVAAIGIDPALGHKIGLAAITTISGLTWALGEPSALDDLINGIRQAVNEYNNRTGNHRD